MNLIKLHAISILELHLVDFLAIDISTVGGTEITQHQVITHHLTPGMLS